MSDYDKKTLRERLTASLLSAMRIEAAENEPKLEQAVLGTKRDDNLPLDLGPLHGAWVTLGSSPVQGWPLSVETNKQWVRYTPPELNPDGTFKYQAAVPDENMAQSLGLIPPGAEQEFSTSYSRPNDEEGYLSMPQPRAGTIVMYRLAPGTGSNGCDEVPAIITRVWSPTCVNLTVFPDFAAPFCKTSVCQETAENPHSTWQFRGEDLF